MKSYTILLAFPLILAFLFSTKGNNQTKKDVKINHLQQSIDSMQLCNEGLILEIQNQTEVFKGNVNAVNKKVDNMIYQLDTLKIDTLLIAQDSIVTDTIKKRKNWLKKTIDKIKN